MTDERRYLDDEIREILDLAIQRDAREQLPVRAEEGLTLTELEEIGREVGLSPERIARAVAELEGRDGRLPRETTLGLPRSVGRLVSLPRAPSDDEWEILVADLRTTFGATGRLTSEGGLRTWSDGKLHALVEPTGAGYQLRLTDARPDAAIAGLAMGAFFLGFALLLTLILLGHEGRSLWIPAFFAVIGAGTTGGSAGALFGWARERERQMEAVADRARALLSSAGSSEA